MATNSIDSVFPTLPSTWEAKVQWIAESTANLQAGYINLESRREEFEAYVQSRTQELNTLEDKLKAALEAADRAKCEADRIRDELEIRLKAAVFAFTK